MPDTKTLSVSERVCAAKAEIGPIPKNGYNKHGGYHHSTVDDVYAALRPVLAKHNLDLKLDIRKADVVMRTSADRGGQTKEVAWVYIEAGIGFEGEEAQTRFLSVPMTGPQTYETINSYLEKQYLRARFQIETGEYDEPETTDNPPVSSPITTSQLAELNAAIEEVGGDPKALAKGLGVADLGHLLQADLPAVWKQIEIKKQRISETAERPKSTPPIDAETGELLPPGKIKVPENEDGSFDWKGWAATLAAALEAAETLQDLVSWMASNGVALSNLSGELPDWHQRLNDLYEERTVVLENGEATDETEPTVGVGDFINWESQGALQFKEPQKVRAVSEDGTHVFVEGSDTGIPIGEVIVDGRQNAGVPESDGSGEG